MLIKSPPVEMTDKLWMLGTDQYPIYVYKGETEGAVFEGGVGAMGPVLKEQIESLGLAPGFIKQMVVTHGHPDHVMAVPLFRELFDGPTVLASEVAAKTLSVEKVISFYSKMDGAITGALLKAGVIDERHRPGPLAEMKIAVDRVIGEGDKVTVDGSSFDVLATPGHSDCSLSFYQPDEKLLIISDASGYYLPDDNYWWPNYFADYGAYLDSLKRLAGLDTEVLCLSHNGAVTGQDDVKAYFQGAIAATEEYHQRILDLRDQGSSLREIAEKLGEEVYEKTQLLPLDFFQKNCGILVKLSFRHAGISDDK